MYEDIEIEWLPDGHHVKAKSGYSTVGRRLNRFLFGTPVLLRVSGGGSKLFYQGHRSKELVEVLKSNGVSHTNRPPEGTVMPGETTLPFEQRLRQSRR